MLDLAGLPHPIIQAPMAGGPSTPELAAAVSDAGGLGFLAAGYLAPEALAERIRTLRGLTEAPFGVNLFVPERHRTDPAQLAEYSRVLQPWRTRWRVQAPAELPGYSDDRWQAKLELLLADPVTAVSFTFGLPGPEVLARLRGVGTWTALTVTSAAEAGRAAALEPDALIVQCHRAGGHRGTLAADAPLGQEELPELLRAVRRVTDLPLIGAGGIGTAEHVRAALEAGAAATQIGTLFAAAAEAGTGPVHRDALLRAAADAAAGRPPETAVTRAFSGRPARALANRFTRELADHEITGYPEVNDLTAPLRAAARRAGDPEAVNLWAGTGVGWVRSAPAREILARLIA